MVKILKGKPTKQLKTYICIEKKECAICLDRMTNGKYCTYQIATMPECGHHFHYIRLQPLIERSRQHECSSCRKSLYV